MCRRRRATKAKAWKFRDAPRALKALFEPGVSLEDRRNMCTGMQAQDARSAHKSRIRAIGTFSLYYTILYYTILYYTILYYTILYYTILYYTILYYTILYYTILYYTILYYTILYYTMLYYTISASGGQFCLLLVDGSGSQGQAIEAPPIDSQR